MPTERDDQDMKFQIEHDVSMFYNEYPFFEMQPGDSFFVPVKGESQQKKKVHALRCIVAQWLHANFRHPNRARWKFKVLPFPLDNPTGVRVWRVKILDEDLPELT